MKSFVLDAGPLVALLDGDDQFHNWAVAQFASLPPAFVTCEAVITEALYVIGHRAAKLVISRLQPLIRHRVITFPFRFEEHSAEVFTLMDRYASVPMSFADACLVRMSELLPDATVFTTDSDFRIYRRNKRQAIPLRCPFS